MIFELQAYVFMVLVLNSASPASFPKAPREHIEQIDNKQAKASYSKSSYSKSSFEHKYKIQVGGTLDRFNTVYYAETYSKFMREEPKFEPNEYLIIENIGDVDVINPRIVVNGRRDWFSADDILASIIKPGMTDAEKAMAIYNFTASIEVQCHENNRRVGPPYPDDNSNPSKNTFSERANPVKAANYYYCSGCSLSAANFVILCRHAGLMARAVWMCPLDVYETHCVGEVWYDDGWHLFDPEIHTYYLEEDNETVASYETLHRNPSLVTRTHDGGFASTGTKTHAQYYQTYYPPHVMPVDQWLSTMSMTLRPGEKFIWRWDNSGKFRYGDNIRNKNYPPYRLANGRMVYQPDLTKSTFRMGTVSELNIKAKIEDGKLPLIHPDASKANGYVIYKVKTAYPVVGGVVGGRFYRKTKDDICRIYISIGEKDWTQVWSADEIGNIEYYVVIDGAINPKPSPAIYEYYIKYEFRADGESIDAGINGIYIETDVQMANTALPSLSAGENSVVYMDETQKPHAVQITHGWKESSEVVPPLPPADPVSPSDGSQEKLDSLKKLIWKAAESPGGEAIADYHIQVSPRPDMLNPVSPNFDRITFSPNPEWELPQGWLMNGKTYFWRVRAKNQQGVWSQWSQIWKFTF